MPSGWELESSTCSGDNTPSSIAVATGGSVTCTFNDQKLGTIIVNKVTQGGDGTFQFTTTSLVSENYPLPSTFSITTDSGHGSYVFNTADADQVYSITENVPAGWELEGITCGYDDHTVNPNAIVVPAGKTVTCTVNDQKLGTLVINKVAQGVDNTGTFNFTTTSLGDENYPLPSIFSIAATSGSGSYTFNTADADQVYSITENVPANWELESTTCTGEGNSASHIVVPAGGLVTCTVNNQELGKIVVDKVTQGGDGTFQFTTTSSREENYPMPSTFSITTTSGSGSYTFNTADADQVYSISENPLTGWEQESFTCSIGETSVDPSHIVVPAGETVICTVNDQKLGTITINKVTEGGDATFHFTTTSLESENYPLPSSFQITTHSGSGSYVFSTADPDQTYSISESALSGWEAEEGTTCVDNNGNTLSPSAITVPAGGSVTCTFTNEKLGNLVIQKTAIGGDGSFTFSTTSSEEDHALPSTIPIETTSGTGNYVFHNTDHDSTYSVIEIVPFGWEQTSATCSDGDSPTDIIVAAGSTVTCSFTDTANATVNVVKNTNGNEESGVGTFNFTFDGKPFSVTTTDYSGETSFTQNVLPGSHTILEQTPNGWKQTSATCSGEEDPSPSEFSVSAGQTITCTFTDTQNATVNVIKDTFGGNGSFGFTMDGSKSFSVVTTDYSGETSFTQNVLPGTHSIVENTPEGWVLVKSYCGEETSPSEFSVSPGGSITCTFVNTPPLKLTLIPNWTKISADQSVLFANTTTGGTGGYVYNYNVDCDSTGEPMSSPTTRLTSPTRVRATLCWE